MCDNLTFLPLVCVRTETETMLIPSCAGNKFSVPKKSMNVLVD